jgi:4-amino-4-deoxy-L-arabinose transferase-like glycosyltransferase
VLVRMRLNGWDSVLLVAILALAVGVRLYEIDYSLDGDELFSVKLASQQFPEVIRVSLEDRPHPPLHNVLLHLWIKAFGMSEASVRALSVLFSAAFLATAYHFLCHLMARWLVLGLLLILALSPLFVYYGQQARPYALIALLASANLLAFVRIMDVPEDTKRVMMWAASCALLLYAQYLGIVVVAVQIAFALLSLPAGRVWILRYGLAACALIVPWFAAAMGGAILSGGEPLPHISWIERPSPSDFLWFYVSIFGQSPSMRTRWLVMVLAVLGGAYAWRFVVSGRPPAMHTLLFLVAFGFPMVVFAASVWGPKPIFVSRQLLVAAIAFVAVAGLCISSLPRTVGAVLLMVLVAWTATSLPQSFPHNAKPPWRDLAQRIDEQYGPIDVITQEGWVGHPLNYYRRSGSVRILPAHVQLEQTDEFMFVCRPIQSKCSKVKDKGLEFRSSLLESWRWGITDSEWNEIRLYRIERTDRRTMGNPH